MPDYIFKTYLADGREHFLYGEMGDGRAQLTKKDFPFSESLLRLLEQVEILKELQPEQQAAYVVKTTRRVAYRHVLRERQSSQQYQSLDDCKDTL